MIDLADNTIVITGGSAVEAGLWDNRNGYSSKKPRTELEEEIDQIMGVYLLALGLVGDSFAYMKYGNIVAIQTHKYGYVAQEHITFVTLLKYMIDSGDKPVTIKNPWWMKDDDREICYRIRRQIEKNLFDFNLPTHYTTKRGRTVPRLMFA